MLTVLLLLVVGTSTTPVPTHAAAPRELTCIARNTADGKDRRCHVKIPAGTVVKACGASEKAAGRCTLDKKARYVAWTVSRGGAECRLSKKSTKWKSRVAIKVGKRTAPGAGTCELRVVVQ